MRLPPVLLRGLALLCLCALSYTAFAKDTVLLFLGDSLTEGLGVPPEAAYPSLIEKELKADQRAVRIVNAGISGSTSASGLARLKWHLKGKEKPDVLVLALGANDGLRGLSVDEMKKNLTSVIELAKTNQIRVLLAGMQMPPNYGKAYTDSYAKAFPDVAQALGVPLVPFLLEGVGGEKDMNQPDGIHPNVEGHKLLAKNVLKHLKPLLDQK
jgi:acyl-CoA thioesterase-1